MLSDQTPSQPEMSNADEFVVTLEGEFDLSNISILRDELSRAIGSAKACIVVDMSDVTFIDSSGLAELVTARNALAEGRSIVIRQPRPNVKKAFDFTGLSPLFGMGE